MLPGQGLVGVGVEEEVDYSEVTSLVDHLKDSTIRLRPVDHAHPLSVVRPITDVKSLKRELLRRRITTGALFSWCDMDRNDAISFREFRRGLSGIGIRNLPSDEILRKFFDEFDTNGDGEVGYREIVMSLEGRKVGYETAKEAHLRQREEEKESVRKHLADEKAMYEYESGALLTEEDLWRGMHKRFHEVGTVNLFMWMDSDRGDRITFEEFVRGLLACGLRPLPRRKVIKAVFEAFDRDEDGAISYQELEHTLMHSGATKFSAVQRAVL
jgi:Ca2+-binding EF-hand superfamily protein